MTGENQQRMERALCSLEGLSVGDAFGERFFALTAEALIANRAVPAPPWPFTDDTQMALSVVEILNRYGRIDQDALAVSFARHYGDSRGYGPAMHGLLEWIRTGVPWGVVARRQFAGQGSYGNGAAMRAAPLGAYLAEDLELFNLSSFLRAPLRVSASATREPPVGVSPW